MPWMRKAPCRNASSVLKMALLISWEDGQARLPTGYHPPLIAPSMSVAPTLRKKTLNSGEPDSLSCSYLLAACAHRCTGGPHTQPYMHAVKALPLPPLFFPDCPGWPLAPTSARTKRCSGRAEGKWVHSPMR